LRISLNEIAQMLATGNPNKVVVLKHTLDDKIEHVA
jgi:hypothetical protein